METTEPTQLSFPPPAPDHTVPDANGRLRCHSFDALESVSETPNGLDRRTCNGSYVPHATTAPRDPGYQALVVVCHNLREELWSCRKQYKLKSEECERISSVRDQMQRELQDLTASLFEEANKMVQEANTERATCEKRLRESDNKVEMLVAEVNALKTLVITSTPNAPNTSLHTHIMPSNGCLTQPCQHCHHSTARNIGNCQRGETGSLGSSMSRGLKFLPGHKRSTSAIEIIKKGNHHNASVPKCRYSCDTGSPSKSSSLPAGALPPRSSPRRAHPERSGDRCDHGTATGRCHVGEGRQTMGDGMYGFRNGSPSTSYEIDPIYFEEFVAWHKEPTDYFPSYIGPSVIPDDQNSVTPTEANKFMERLYGQDILPTLEFRNGELSSSVLMALRENKLVIEALYDNEISAPRECSLTQTTKICPYRMKLSENADWYYIGESTRNRIVSVGDILSYLRYIQKGIVKSEIDEMYWEIMKFKKQMALARFSFLG